MFSRVFASATAFQRQNNFQFKYIKNCLNYHPKSQVNYSSTVDAKKEDFSEQDKIEESLFGNLDREHRPVASTEELLKEYNKPKKWQNSSPRFNKKHPADEKNVINDKSLGLSYIKLNHNDPVLHKILITARSNKRREKQQSIIIEGNRLIDEALTCEYPLQTIVFSRKEQLELIKDKVMCYPSASIYKVPHHDIKLWSALNTPPGLIGIFKKPVNKITNIIQLLDQQRFPITVICDNIREPNNLGSIIRTCAAIPCQKVVILKGCCDPWETKALRGGCGGQFRIAIEDNVNWQDIESNITKESAVFIAENNLKRLQENSVDIHDYTKIKKSQSNVLIIGGETHGISQEAYNFLKNIKGTGIHIPLADGIDSLNTAAALTLILFQMKQNYLIV